MKPLLFALLFLMPTNAIAADLVDVLDDMEETMGAWRTKKESEINTLCFKLAAVIPRHMKNIADENENGALTEMAPLLSEANEYLARAMTGAVRETYRRIRSFPHAHEAAREKCKKLLTERLDGLSWY